MANFFIQMQFGAFRVPNFNFANMDFCLFVDFSKLLCILSGREGESVGFHFPTCDEDFCATTHCMIAVADAYTSTKLLNTHVVALAR